MEMSEKVQRYRVHLQSMQKFCLEVAIQSKGDVNRDYWKTCANVWRLAEEGLHAYFDVDDLELEAGSP